VVVSAAVLAVQRMMLIVHTADMEVEGSPPGRYGLLFAVVLGAVSGCSRDL
jgi:hypothetical protein